MKFAQMQYEWACESWAFFNRELGEPNEAVACNFLLEKPKKKEEPWMEVQCGDLAVFDLDPKVYMITGIQAYQTKNQTGTKMP